jgi:hypothetical protein
MLRLRRNRKGQRGQIIVLFELVIIICLMVAALVIDIGVLRNNRQILVNTMDAAALAGGSQLPVDASNVDAANALIAETIQVDYPGLPSSMYSISYRCLIGANDTGPLIARDIPAVCNPTNALGHAPIASDFTGAGPTRVSACDPYLGDTCNVVVVSGTSITEYRLAPVVGLNQGSTGGVTSAACRGACGAAPVVPVDLVIVLDRTMSMSGSSGGKNKIQSLQNAAKAVLSVYNPAQQRVGLVLTGPGKINSSGAPVTGSCPGGGTAYGVADNDNWSPLTTLNAAITSTTATTIKVNGPKYLGFKSVPFDIAINTERMTVTAVSGSSAPYTWTVTRGVKVGTLSTTAATHSSGTSVYGAYSWTPSGTTVGMWEPVGLSGTDSDSPPASPSGAAGTYSIDGVPNTSSTIVKAINCISAASDGTDLATPIRMAQWYLDNYGRPGVTEGIIVETDGHPQYGFDSTNAQPGTTAAHTCQAAYDAAAAAKADKTNDPNGIQVFTIGYGVDNSVYCPTKATSVTQGNGDYNIFESSTWSHKHATDLLAAMATDSAHYFENPSSDQLEQVFTQAATQLVGGGAHLIQLYPAPIVTGASGGASSVSITGRYFTGAEAVYFGGGAASFTVSGDSSITAHAPSKPSGTVVDVVVVTPGGFSVITPADHYTYP